VILQVSIDFIFLEMTTRVCIFKRVPEAIREPVEALRIGRIGYNGIRTEPAVNIRVVIAGVVKVQSNCSIFPLTCKAVAGGRGPGGVAGLAVGVVAQLADLGRAGAVDGDGGGAKLSAG
jgi:hypothetical protein